NGGRHTTGKGFVEDCRKYNAAAKLGWTVLRFPTAQVKSGEAIDDVSEYLWRQMEEAVRSAVLIGGRGRTGKATEMSMSCQTISCTTFLCGSLVTSGPARGSLTPNGCAAS